MKTKLAVLVAGVLLFAGSSWAQGERKDLQVFNDISKTVNRYSFFTIFDDVSASVESGNVTLTGKVTQPFKRDEIEKRVAKIDGVQHVTDRIEVLPVSGFDQELRYRIARSIYGNANFWNYAIMANPPIHIIVEHGHVTLDRRRAKQRRPHAREVARDAVRCDVGEERVEDRGRGQGAA